MNLTTTGIPGLDAQIGGFPVGSTILFLSEPCNATSVFAEQFAAGGILKGEKVLYYSLERPADEIRKNISQPESMSAEKAGAVNIIDRYSDAERRRPGGKKGKKWEPLGEIEHLISSEKIKAPYRIVIESMSSVLMESGQEDVISLFEKIVHSGRKNGGVNLIMMTKNMHGTQMEYTAKHLADGVLEIGLERRGFGVYPYIMITKLRGVRESTKMLLYRETDKGLWLESTRRVF